MTSGRQRLSLEIAVSSPAGARAALDGGADRVELCVGLELGGLTPSQGLIEATVAVGLPVHVLIRPRPGDFVFSADEVDLMERETRAAVASGASGVVIGALLDDGSLDEVALTRLVEVAVAAGGDASGGEGPAAGGRGVELTLHRAVDQSQDPVAAASRLAGLGFTRVLTSGGSSRASSGLATLEAMARMAGGVQVMAGGGVDVADIGALVATGVDAVHLSAKKPARRAGGGWVSLGTGSTSADSDSHFVTEGTIVAAARRALDAASHPAAR